MPDLYKRTKLWMRPSEKEIASVYGEFNEVFSGDQEEIKTAWWDLSDPRDFIAKKERLIIAQGYTSNAIVVGDVHGTVNISGGNIAYTYTTIGGANIAYAYTTLTKIDLIENKDDETKNLVTRIGRNSRLSCREELANRLAELFSDSKEEDPDSVGINADSLRSFNTLLSSYPNLKCPEVSLTPDNDLYISWKREQDKLFSVHLFPNGDSRFVLFLPNDLHPGRPIRISGLTTTDKLIETVSSQGVLDWIQE
jgi:hypothetical protein